MPKHMRRGSVIHSSTSEYRTAPLVIRSVLRIRRAPRFATLCSSPRPSRSRMPSSPVSFHRSPSALVQCTVRWYVVVRPSPASILTLVPNALTKAASHTRLVAVCRRLRPVHCQWVLKAAGRPSIETRADFSCVITYVRSFDSLRKGCFILTATSDSFRRSFSPLLAGSTPST